MKTAKEWWVERVQHCETKSDAIALVADIQRDVVEQMRFLYIGADAWSDVVSNTIEQIEKGKE